jgi:hypothetical protein
MAAPSSLNLSALAPSHYTLNTSLSTPFTSILALQGINTLIRHAAASTTVHLTITECSDTRLCMKQTAMSSSLPGTDEEYEVDWTWRGSSNALFGKVEGRARWVGAEEAKSAGVVEESDEVEWVWADGEEERLLQAEGKDADGKWEARHLLGFELLDGNRRFTRRVYVRNREGEEVRGVMVWDYVDEK